MTYALPWSVVIPYCFYSMFIFYQQLHARNFRGASQAFLAILSISALVGSMTGLAFLVYYGYKVIWWSPFLLFGIGFAFQFVANWVEDIVGPFTISLLGFIGWPLCAALMFSSVPDIGARNEEIKAITEYIAAMESANLATGVVNSGEPYKVMSVQDSEKLIKHYKDALLHANAVNAEVLDRKYEEWGTRFNEQFLMGLRLVVEGHEKGDTVKAVAGQRLMDAWGEWYSENLPKIRNLE